MSTALDPTLLRAPFVYFGGKRAIAARIWALLGDVPNYVEPFFGSGAVLLSRPGYDPRRHTETANDADGMVSNAWRAIRGDPAAVAHWADWPVNENDLHARHAWLVGQKASLHARLEGDPFWYDARIAGWWIWGLACWIGSGFCSGQGPWQVEEGELRRQERGAGIKRQRPHLGHTGQGVKRKLVHLGDAGKGVARKRVHLGGIGNGNGVHAVDRALDAGLPVWMHALATRLRRVRVCCGDWARVCGPSVTIAHGLTGLYFDPPYGAEVGRYANIYTVDDGQVAAAVRAYCVQWGKHPLVRIVLSGYGDEHDALLAHGWRKEGWQANGGMGNQGTGAGRTNKAWEMLWISPGCVGAAVQGELF